MIIIIIIIHTFQPQQLKTIFSWEWKVKTATERAVATRQLQKTKLEDGLNHHRVAPDVWLVNPSTQTYICNNARFSEKDLQKRHFLGGSRRLLTKVWLSLKLLFYVSSCGFKIGNEMTVIQAMFFCTWAEDIHIVNQKSCTQIKEKAA